MKYKEERAGDSFISWQGVLTPDPVSILQNVTGSVRDLAAGAMPTFLEWLESKRIGKSGINICIADFIDLCDFPMKVVRMNYKLDPR